MLAIAQYLTYFLIGTLFLIFIAGFFSVAAGFGIMALVLLFLPMFLAGYASGLSLLFPRIAAIIAIIFVLPFFLLGIYSMFGEAVGFDPIYVIAPAGIVILISVFALLWSKTSIWSQQEPLSSKILVGVFAAILALLATYMIIGTLINLFAPKTF